MRDFSLLPSQLHRSASLSFVCTGGLRTETVAMRSLHALKMSSPPLGETLEEVLMPAGREIQDIATQ